MGINFDSAAAVPIINVPGLHPHKLVSQEISPSPKCSPGHISYEIWPHCSISGNLAPSYDTYKNLSIFHENVLIMNTLDKST